MELKIGQKNIKNIILDKIKNKNIKSIPKPFFILKSVLFVLSIVIVVCFLLFLVSFIFFTLQTSNLWSLPKFGFKGIELLLGNFPWILVLIVLFFIGVLEFLVERYSFVYRKPLLYSALTIILVVVVAGFFVRQTSLHEKIYSGFDKGGSPSLKKIYDRYIYPTPDTFHPGTVTKFDNNSFVLENNDQTTILVKITKETGMAGGLKIERGSKLLVIGKIKDNIIIAEAIDNAPAGGRP